MKLMEWQDVVPLRATRVLIGQIFCKLCNVPTISCCRPKPSNNEILQPNVCLTWMPEYCFIREKIDRDQHAASFRFTNWFNEGHA